MTYLAPLQPQDPPPIITNPCTGAGPAECVWCGAATAAIPGFATPGCEPCLRRRAQATEVTPQWLALLSSRRGQLGLSHRTAVERHVRQETPVVVPVKIKILRPATTIYDWRSPNVDRVPNHARRLAFNAVEYGRRVRLTYALAEDMTKAGGSGDDALIHSLCVRLWTAEGVRFGYASYVNGRASSCVLWGGEEGGPRKCGVEEFAALAVGKTWQRPAPPPVGPCYVCWRSVRWTQAGKPFKHKAEDGLPCWAGQA